ncbi:MAG: CvpA family protein [Clostridia bacterium]|nr:CvpA family protein [Clostridia bacterium]
MNVVDYVILGIVGVSMLFGLYRGFVASVLNTGGCLVSLGLSFWLYPKASELIRSNVDLQRILLTYTDASSRIGDLNTAVTTAGNLSAQGIQDVLNKVQLPAPMAEILQKNLVDKVYGSTATVSSYVSQTVLSTSVSILCFLITFVLLYIVISLAISIIKAVFRFPVLKQMDSLAGGVFGILRGMIFVFALFALVPLVQTVVPIDAVTDLISESTLSGLFNSGVLVKAIMNGGL